MPPTCKICNKEMAIKYFGVGLCADCYHVITVFENMKRKRLEAYDDLCALIAEIETEPDKQEKENGNTKV